MRTQNFNRPFVVTDDDHERVARIAIFALLALKATIIILLCLLVAQELGSL